MDPKKVKSIFLHAVEHCTPSEWPAYWDEACGEDTNLRHGVALLLAAHQEDDDLAEQGREAWNDALPTIDLPPITEKPGTVIGRYKLLEEIGEGGMGVVYMAEQQEPVHRQVALKIIKPGMDTRAVVARFEAERQALAMMNHPNIAKVFDAGATEEGARDEGRGVREEGFRVRGSGTRQTDESDSSLAPHPPPLTPLGRPYFVMELVQGIPLTDYCDQHQLTTRERLELFVQVCLAVQHAHQKGIIHRDIKPSNVLVALYDGAPVPKIIDFGIAKAVHRQPAEAALATGGGLLMGTPLYMSPEQAGTSGLDVDTRSDIYSLGVMLYELLTGGTPFGQERVQKAGYDEIRRMIREEEPPRPSARISTLGEAGATVSALRKTEPAKLSRLVRGDLDWIVMKALEKDPARRYQTANDLARDIQRHLADEPIEARPPTLLDRAARWARRHKPLVRSTAVLLLAAVIATVVVAWNRYQKVLQIEQHLTAAGAFLQAGDYVAADRELAEARARLDAVFYPSGGLAADLAGLTGQVSGKKEAEERFQRFQEYRQSVHANMYNATPNTMDRVQEKCRAALALYRVFDSDRLEGQEGFELLSPQRRAMLKEAVAELLFAWAEMEAAREQEPRDLPEAHRRTIAALERIERVYRPIPAVYLWIAQSRRALGEADAARQAEKRAAAHRPVSGLDYFILGEFHYMCEEQPEKALADYSLALRRQPDHYLSLLATGLTLWERKRHNEAVAMLTGAIAVNPRTTIAYIWRANSCWKLRQFDLAQADLDAAVAIDPQDYHAYWVLGQVRRAQGDNGGALAMFDKAVALAPTTPAPLLHERGEFHAELGNRDKALADFSRVIEWLHPRLGLSQSIPHYRGAMAADPLATYIMACHDRSRIHKQVGQLDKAQDDLKEALRTAPNSVGSYAARGKVEAEQGAFDKAIADYDEAIRLGPKSAAGYVFRGNAYSHKHDFQHAIADFEKAIELQPESPLNCGNLAWFLVTCPERRIWNPGRAVELAKKATQLAPGNGIYWNTLGVAQYRAGDHEAAIKALGKSTELGSGGVACDWFFFAMAHWQLKHTEEARRWYDKGAAWMEKNKSDDEELLRFRAEAEDLLGITAKPPAGKEKPEKGK
jgi:tetratricopeptide (TPR) repeat protein